MVLLRNNKIGIEATLRIERGDCAVTNFIYYNNIKANIERLKIDGKNSIHTIKLLYGSLNVLYNQKNDFDIIKASKKTVWAKSSCCSACSIIGSLDLVILSSKTINEYTVDYRVLIPNHVIFNKLKKSLNESGLKYSIFNVSYKDNTGLTDRENEILIKLYENGYFDSTRKISLTDMAKSMDISTSALAGMLRKSLKKIVKQYIEDKT